VETTYEILEHAEHGGTAGGVHAEGSETLRLGLGDGLI
jgi:hypothetical protein